MHYEGRIIRVWVIPQKSFDDLIYIINESASSEIIHGCKEINLYLIPTVQVYFLFYTLHDLI